MAASVLNMDKTAATLTVEFEARRGRLGAVERKPREAAPLRPDVREAGIAAMWGRIRGTLESPLYTYAAGPHVRRVRGFAGTGKVFSYP